MNLARRTMNAPALAAVYEHVAAHAVLPGQRPHSAAIAARPWTRCGSAVARRCSIWPAAPANFTRYLSEFLAGDGFVTGLDYSEPMLAKAAADNAGPRVGYVRGDARALPFADGTFDAVCCFGALYLIPDPIAATREMIRCSRRAARIAITTSFREDNLFGRASTVAAGLSGLRLFGRDTFHVCSPRPGWSKSTSACAVSCSTSTPPGALTGQDADRATSGAA